MKEIAVISGKGGTGKTTVAASLAALAGNAVIADCDVDAANLHLLLNPKEQETHEFRASKKAVIEHGMCSRCGHCLELCRFKAIEVDVNRGVTSYRVNDLACEGCSVCEGACPEGAIVMKGVLSGHWFISKTRFGPFVHARLRCAEANSGRLVTLIRKKAKEIGEQGKHQFIICDGSPGVGCPVIASLAGVDTAVIVTEPTLSGIHDLTRVLELCKQLSVEPLVVINKWDISAANTAEIEAVCEKEGVPVACRIPFDRMATKAMMKGLPVVLYGEGVMAKELKKLAVSLFEEE